MKKNNVLDDRPVFIVGMQRSGTGLMRSLLGAHSSIALSPHESSFFKLLNRLCHLDLARRDDLEIFWQELCQTTFFSGLNLDPDEMKRRIHEIETPDHKTVFATLLREYARKEGKSRWGDKTPHHDQQIDVLVDWYPQAKVIYMMRDPRAVVASLLTVSWGDHKLRPYVDGFAERWRQSVGIADRWATDTRVAIVRYETLVSHTVAELRRICKFLDEDYEPSMLTAQARSAERGTMIEAGTPRPDRYGPVVTDSIERWRTVLSPTQVAIVEHVARPAMLRHDYQPTTEHLPRLLVPQLLLMRGARRSVRWTRRLRPNVRSDETAFAPR